LTVGFTTQMLQIRPIGVHAIDNADVADGITSARMIQDVKEPTLLLLLSDVSSYRFQRHNLLPAFNWGLRSMITPNKQALLSANFSLTILRLRQQHKQRDAEGHQGYQKCDDHESHHAAHRDPGDCQKRQGEEGLNHVGNRFAHRYGHGGTG
jgi:hypothetical protein